MARYFLRLAFKGTQYHGWQIQKNAQSVQQILNEALTRITRENIYTVGAGRTDTGVHASYFIAHFDAEGAILKDKTNFLFRLNGVLPKDIAVYDIFQVKENNHARFDAISRTYQYVIVTHKDPFWDEFSNLITLPLDVDAMERATSALFHYSDFSSFCKSKSGAKTMICNVEHVSWEQNGHKVVFTITADRFLRNMVRAIVGTALNVGLHKISVDDFSSIIEQKNRSSAGTSAPAEGLFLTHIQYPYLPE